MPFTTIAAANLSTERLGDLDFAITLWLDDVTKGTDQGPRIRAAAALGFSTWEATEAFILANVYQGDDTFRTFLAGPVFAAMEADPEIGAYVDGLAPDLDTPWVNPNPGPTPDPTIEARDRATLDRSEAAQRRREFDLEYPDRA